jgi:superfamily I DNA/RNA helicase
VREVAWTEADLALIDEADARLGSPDAARPRRRRNRRRFDDDAATRVVADLGVGGFLTAAQLAERYGSNAAPAAEDSGEPRTFGHVLVDEAQDLSPMQWRMLARRCPSGSMTIVGDFGQASRAGSASGWDEVQSLIPTHVPVRHVTLTVNYRTPSEIMAVAARVLAAAALDIEPPDSVRATGIEPEFVGVEAHRLVEEVHRRAAEAISRPGTKAVIAPLERHAALVEALQDLGAVAGTADALDAPIAILGPVEAKGLEFDEVIAVEPAELVQPDRRGLRLLYVTLTRATQRLQVVHARPLPEALAPAVPPAGPAEADPDRSPSWNEVMSS